MQSVDVAIVGGGMVGLAVACGLQGSGLRVAVLEQHVPQPLAADAPPQLRVSAINAASEKLLTRLGVWSDIVARRACCYHGMEVWDKDSFGRIAFDDQSMGYSHLGAHCRKLRDSLCAVAKGAAFSGYYADGTC